MSQSEALTFETTAGPRALDDIAAALDRAWSENPHVPKKVRTHVAIAVAEISANILEHATAGWIRIQIRVLANQIEVDLVDDGRPADLDLTAARLPDQFAERGRGIALAQAALDQLSYRRDPANHWTLVSRRFG